MEYFKNYPDTSTPLPKVIWWYALETNYKGCLNAEYCNYLLNNELKDFFEEFPEELTNGMIANPIFGSYITEQEIAFYKKQIFK